MPSNHTHIRAVGQAQKKRGPEQQMLSWRKPRKTHPGYWALAPTSQAQPTKPVNQQQQHLPGNDVTIEHVASHHMYKVRDQVYKHFSQIL